MGFFSRSDNSSTGMFSKREKWGSFYENSGEKKDRKEAIAQRAQHARDKAIEKANRRKQMERETRKRTAEKVAQRKADAKKDAQRTSKGAKGRGWFN